LKTADTLLALAAMPEFLEGAARRLAGEKALEPGPDQGFSFLEQVWHLADLERRGYGERIRRILSEERPALADFDGAREAREGRYRERALSEGLAAFRQSRGENLAALRSLTESQWARPATQEGVGELRLADVARMMAGHDASHRGEIRQLLGEAPTRERAGGSSALARALGLLFFLPLLGCPYESPVPLGSPADNPRDARLLGQWRCVSGSNDNALIMSLSPLEQSQYSITMRSPGEEPLEARGYVSKVKGGAVLNVQQMKDGKPQEGWSFARYLLPTRSSLVWDLAEDTLLKDVPKTASALQAALEGPKSGEIFEPFCVCAKVEERGK
jgi:hypothetical protein